MFFFKAELLFRIHQFWCLNKKILFSEILLEKCFQVSKTKFRFFFLHTNVFQCEFGGSKRAGKILEVTNTLGDLARAVSRRTGTERRAACFGIRTWLRVRAAIKAH